RSYDRPPIDEWSPCDPRTRGETQRMGNGLAFHSQPQIQGSFWIQSPVVLYIKINFHISTIKRLSTHKFQALTKPALFVYDVHRTSCEFSSTGTASERPSEPEVVLPTAFYGLKYN